MNKRHLTVFITVGILIGSVILVLMMRTGCSRKTEACPESGNKPKHVQSARNKGRTSESAMTGETLALTAIKPKSIKMGQGSTAVIEIDHGLQAVDFMKGERYPAAVTRAQEKGALGAVTFSIVDDRGQPVSGATVKASFWNHGQKGHDFEKTTDENGLVALQDTCVGDLNFSVMKEGHYKTRLRYWFFKAYFDCAKDGKWMPWNPVIEIVLKRKVNPVAMYCKTATVLLPDKDKSFGFDCIMSDLVEPYGNGKKADFSISYSLVYDKENIWNATNHLHITFAPGCGAVLMKSDAYSQMNTIYSAPESGYINHVGFYLKSLDQAHREERTLASDEYIVFKSRTVFDEQGRETNSHFGKIISKGFWYGEKSKDGTGGKLIFSFYLNPTPNDRNLEFDGQNNLFKPDWQDTSWPREP